MRLTGVLVAAACSAACAETALWPSDTTEMRAQEDSAVEALPDGRVRVTTGTTFAWPGVRMDFVDGPRDISGYDSVTVCVSNTTDTARTVCASLKDAQGTDPTPSHGIALKPGEAGKIEVKLPRMPWAVKGALTFEGMNGHPQVSAKAKTFDPKHVTSIHIFHCQDGTAGGFAVSRVFMKGNGKPFAQKVYDAETFLPFVDKYGQFKHDDWPGKAHSDADLAAARKAEAAWLKTHAAGPRGDVNKYGGWLKGPQLKATGFFRTEKVDGKWWLVDPEGRLFFSHGVDCVGVGCGTTGIGHRERYFEWVPKKDDPLFGKLVETIRWPAAHSFYKDPAHLPYDAFSFANANLVRKYGPEWQAGLVDRAHRRLRAWGLNTIGNWSWDQIWRADRTPYTSFFNTRGPAIEGSSGWWGKLRDPFAEEFVKNARSSAAREAEKSGRDPWCVGWFVDNELSWGHDDMELARALVRSPAGQPGKAAFKSRLAAKYGGVAKLNAAWGTAYADWDAFLSVTNLPDAKRDAVAADFKDMHRAVVAQYFRTVAEAIKAAAPGRLYLGARIAWGSPVVYEESARYCDVVSVNIYKHKPEKDLPEGAVDKPMINGEFHFGALDRGLFHTGLVPTKDQDARAKSYRDFVNACLDHPRYVGTHWFQWQDQALTGRSDGENYQIGFLDVTDAPYPELVAAARAVAAKMYERRYGR